MMIRITPAYYKDFKCIAGACTDTCCAGWDVDVDEKSYQYYKKVKGEFGKRLKSVMVPAEEGGCTFTLKDGRCPFLNDENLCDLYTELGEDKLCETCAEFPRFINVYGNVVETGIAPSCITAGEIIFNYDKPLEFVEEQDDVLPESYNDIEPVTYLQLRSARDIAYGICSDNGYTINERLILLLNFAKEIQKHLDNENDYLISNVVKKYSMVIRRDTVLENCKNRTLNQEKREALYHQLVHFFDSFKGMEVINPDWNKYVAEVKYFFERIQTSDQFVELVKEFDAYYADRQFEYEQLIMYYLYRYFLDAVYDYNVLLKLKNAVTGYIVLKIMDISHWYFNDKKLEKAAQIDMAHLYSRQFEHSYYNFEVYSEWFMKKRRYSYNSLINYLKNL